MSNPDYIPETKVVEADYIHSNFIVRAGFGNTNETYSLEFNRWLKQVQAEAWAEGFDAGERDVWEHERNEDGWDSECTPNPYLEESE